MPLSPLFHRRHLSITPRGRWVGVAVAALYLIACRPEPAPPSSSQSPPPAPAAAGHDHGGQQLFAPSDVSQLMRDSKTAGVAGQGAAVPLLVPGDVDNPSWVEGRKLAQEFAAKRYTVDHQFRFQNRQVESGIRFRHHIVDDAGKAYKGVHYDHGNGLAVADVDGDGWLDIYFVSQLGGNELWRNLGNGKFANITTPAGVAVPDRVSVGASFADSDNDGDPDLFVTTVRAGNLLFENQGQGVFKDISHAAGLDYVGHSSGAVFFDYDRDGRLDLFVANIGRYTTDEKGPGGYWVGYADAFSGHLKPERSEPSILYKNLGGNRFQDVTAQVDLVDLSWSGDASPLDVNEDGWLDLYLLNMQGHDEYYENEGGRRFVKKSRAVFPQTPWGSMGIRVFDFDNDGRQDIFITDMHTDMVVIVDSTIEKQKAPKLYPPEFLATDGQHIRGNALFHNQGGGKFNEISDAAGVENFWPWGPSSGDLNADGFEDLFIAASMNYPWRYGVNSVLLNDGGKVFRDCEYLLGVEPRAAGSAQPWFTLDCAGADAAHPHCTGQSGRIEVWGARGSRSAAIFDLDQDSDLDIVTSEFNAEPLVLISDLAARRAVRFLAIQLRGTVSNRNGLGVIVTVEAGGRSWVKVHDGRSGYLAQSDAPLYFGLGEAQQVDRIRVRWPSGREQTLNGPLASNRTLEVREP